MVAKPVHLVASQLGSDMADPGMQVPPAQHWAAKHSQGTREARTLWVWCSYCKDTTAEVCGGRG